jgi:hypothetical protein
MLGVELPGPRLPEHKKGCSFETAFLLTNLNSITSLDSVLRPGLD